MNVFMLLAQRGADSPANKWLAEHPLVLGLIALAIGAALAGSGVYGLRKGVAHDKYGNEVKEVWASLCRFSESCLAWRPVGLGFTKWLLDKSGSRRPLPAPHHLACGPALGGSPWPLW